MKVAQYSTQLEYATVERNTTSGAPYRASFFENLDSRSMKSMNRARPGIACRARSIGRGFHTNASGVEDSGSVSKIKDGENKINVQYIEDIMTAN